MIVVKISNLLKNLPEVPLVSFMESVKPRLFGKDVLQPNHKAVGMKRHMFYRGQVGGLQFFSQFKKLLALLPYERDLQCPSAAVVEGTVERISGQQVVVLVYELNQMPSSVVTAVDRVMGWRDNCTDLVRRFLCYC